MIYLGIASCLILIIFLLGALRLSGEADERSEMELRSLLPEKDPETIP